MRTRILKATVGAILKMEAGTLSRVSSAPSTADEDGADRNISPRVTPAEDSLKPKADIKDFCQLKELVNLVGKCVARNDRRREYDHLRSYERKDRINSQIKIDRGSIFM